MQTEMRSKGTWFHRFAIRFFTLVLGVLVFWLLGFLVEDIRTLRGPEFRSIEEKHVDRKLVEKRDGIDQQIAGLTVQIANQTEKQRVVGDSSKNLQQTIGQLIELQKLGLQKSVSFSATEQANFTSSLNLFLENQKRYQQLSQTVSDMLEQKQGLAREREQLEKVIQQQRKPAADEYAQQSSRHRLKLACLQLAILLPILFLAVAVSFRKRGSIYFPLLLAVGAAALVKVTLVIHEYFPTRYFKYILITGLLLIVVRLLVYFIRTIAYPKAQWLVKQYREAYERFLCPICEYPIRVGPRRFLFWTRRTVHKVALPAERADAEEPYTCPSCGTRLLVACEACHKIRHALLPHCSHCGAETEIR